ncbi:MAG: hypothetical protein IJP89_06910 [Synergistaceae bacterium]|nr:hypothetical protein [Synergistaceae bacterium]
MGRILRVFPRRNKATPEDEYAITEYPGLFMPDDVQEVHVSCAFTYDLERAYDLADAWSKYYPVKLGGPTFNEPGGEFHPGMYLKEGYVITSRGCPNHCWFCAVPKREYKGLHELEIKDGWNVLDDNLLACSERHIRGVFEMLSRQKHKARFTGGLEAKLLKAWHCELLRGIKPERIYFAYDTPDDYEPLREASKLLSEYGLLKMREVSVYCLCGYPNDTMEKAESRFMEVLKLGMCPYAMLWRDKTGEVNREWRKFQRLWVAPQIIYMRVKNMQGGRS